MKKILIFIFMTVEIFAQENIKIDGSSIENLNKSVLEARKNLPLDKKKEFEKASDEIIKNNLMITLYSKGDKDMFNKLLIKEIGGHTIDEIITEGKRLADINITGGFGIKLGEVFDPSTAISKKGKSDDDITYKINPPKKLKYFDDYNIKITPKTHKVYQISGIKDYKGAASCSKQLNIITILLEGKYGTFGKNGDTNMIMKKSSMIRIECSEWPNAGMMLILYVNNDLAKLSEKEAAELDKENIDTTAL